MLSFIVELTKNLIAVGFSAGPNVNWDSIRLPNEIGETPLFYFELFQYALKLTVQWTPYLFPMISGVAALVLSVVIRVSLRNTSTVN